MRKKLLVFGFVVAMLLVGCKTTEEAAQDADVIVVQPTKEPVLSPEQSPMAQTNATQMPAEPTDVPEQLTPTQAAPTTLPTPTLMPTPTLTPTPTPTPTKAPVNTSTPTPTKAPVNTSTPTPTKAPIQTVSTLEQVTVNGKKISVGDSVSTLTATLGTPVRKDNADGNFTYYVYNKDYKNFSMVAISNAEQKVVGFFVCSVNLTYGGLSSAATLSSFQSKYSAAEALSDIGARMLEDSAGTSVFFFDIHNDSKLYAVSYMASAVSFEETNASTQTAVEREILDICNAYRARYGVASLTWSSDAAAIAKAYAKKMAAEDFFSHTSPDGSTMASRCESINYRTLGENIIANYMLLGHLRWQISGSVANATGWIASSGHRGNILNDAFTHLGVGIAGGSNSTYKDYGVQVFYAPR